MNVHDCHNALDIQPDEASPAGVSGTMARSRRTNNKNATNKANGAAGGATALGVSHARTATRSASSTNGGSGYDFNLSGSILISRNKHWKYISSYHGPWLQLPVELLESLFFVNNNIGSLGNGSSLDVGGVIRCNGAEGVRACNSTHCVDAAHNCRATRRLPGYGADSTSFSSAVDPEALARDSRLASRSPLMHAFIRCARTPVLPMDAAGHDNSLHQPSPPIDPTAFKNIVNIRRLIDDAADLAVLAASGEAIPPGALGAASGFSSPLSIASPSVVGGCFRNGLCGGGTLGNGLLGSVGSPACTGGGRGSKTLTRLRQQKLRELAVNKLALAYRIDEIAAAVVTMQSATALEDVAAAVLKRNPNHLDAIYVNFFHEKIPSRMLSESTSTDALDRIVGEFPTTAEYYRTRGIVKCFKEDYPGALKDFKAALAYARHRSRTAKKRRAAVSSASRGFAGECNSGPGYTNGGCIDRVHPAAGGEEQWCSGTEAQVLFFRGACFFQYAVSLIEEQMQKAEDEFLRRQKKRQQQGNSGHRHGFSDDGKVEDEGSSNANSTRTEPSLFTLEASGGGPVQAPIMVPYDVYRDALTPLSHRVTNLARRAARDYEAFISCFPSLPGVVPAVNLGLPGSQLRQRSGHVNGGPLDHTAREMGMMKTPEDAVEYHANTGCPSASVSAATTAVATYHPLLVEAYHGLLLSLCLIATVSANDEGDSHPAAPPAALLRAWHCAFRQVERALEAYPVFVPARSLTQADYAEVLARIRRWARGSKVPAWWEWWKDDSEEDDGKKRNPAAAGERGASGLHHYSVHSGRADAVFAWVQVVSVPAWVHAAGAEKSEQVDGET